MVGGTVTLPCPNAGATLSRTCTADDTWGPINSPDCISEEILELHIQVIMQAWRFVAEMLYKIATQLYPFHVVCVLPQLENLKADPAVALMMDPHLIAFTEQLVSSVTVNNITFAGDIPQVVDIVQDIVDLLENDTFENLPVSYQVTMLSVFHCCPLIHVHCMT